MHVLSIVGVSQAAKAALSKELFQNLAARQKKLSYIQEVPDVGAAEHTGLSEVMLVSPCRMVLTRDLPAPNSTRLAELIQQLGFCDYLFVDGFEESGLPKIEVLESSDSAAALWPRLTNVIAVVSTQPGAYPHRRLHIDDVDSIASFIIDYFE